MNYLLFKSQCYRQLFAQHQFDVCKTSRHKEVTWLYELNQAPKLLSYAEPKTDNQPCTILAMEALLVFKPIDGIAQHWFSAKQKTRQQNWQLFDVVAQVVRDFHNGSLVHRVLYSKYLFVKSVGIKPEIAFIDLEKSRSSWLFLYRAYFDLAALNRHAEYWSASDRIYFFLQYFQVSALNKWLRLIGRQIVKRSTRR